MKESARMLIRMPSAKVKMINVRLSPEIHDAFKIACELRGASMSSLLHQFVVRTIREERETDPLAFKPVQSAPRLAATSTPTPVKTGKTDTQAKRRAR